MSVGFWLFVIVAIIIGVVLYNVQHDYPAPFHFSNTVQSRASNAYT